MEVNVRLFCDPTNCSPPGSSVHGILQARILEWVAISFSRGSSRPRDWTASPAGDPALAGRFFTPEPLGKPLGTWEIANGSKFQNDTVQAEPTVTQPYPQRRGVYKTSTLFILLLIAPGCCWTVQLATLMSDANAWQTGSLCSRRHAVDPLDRSPASASEITTIVCMPKERKIRFYLLIKRTVCW